MVPNSCHNQQIRVLVCYENVEGISEVGRLVAARRAFIRLIGFKSN